MDKLLETIRKAHDALTTQQDRHLFKSAIEDAMHDHLERQRIHKRRAHRLDTRDLKLGECNGSYYDKMDC